jgi:L-lactate dehydrogenase
MLKNKVTIIGAGLVGSTIAYSLVSSRTAEEIALIDINQKLSRSQAMDLQHSVPFWGYAKIRSGSYTDLKDSRIVVITCGASQKAGETRLDLLKKNAVIIKELMPEIFKRNPNIIVIMVTNPVTILDSARLRFLLGERLSVDPKSLHAYIIGEHGDSEVPLWSTATLGNTPLDRFEKLSKKEKDAIFDKAKNAAYAIIEGKMATYYAIAAGVAKLIRAVLTDKKTVFTVSHPVDGRFGISGVSLSLPCVIGAKGILKDIDIELSQAERALLKQSGAKLKKAEKSLGR